MRHFPLLILLFSIQNALIAQNSKNQQVVTGTVLLNDKSPIDAKSLFNTIKTDWKLKADSLKTGDKTITFTVPGATVTIAQLAYPGDPIEIRAAAQLSWMWKNATEEALRHQSQVVVSVIGSSAKSLELHEIFSKVAAAILENTHSSGVYMNGQYLLVSKGFYSSAAHNLLDNQTLPVYCWVYFGMPGDGGAYTFGMQEFGLKEMEIVKSTHINAEVHGTIYDMAVSAIKYNLRPLDGEVITTEEGSKIKVHNAKGVFLEGHQVLALEF